MIKHSPAENYIKFLIVHPACYDNRYIKDVAREMGLDILGDWYLTWLRERIRPPVPFFPEDKSHARSEKFLVAERLEHAFRPDRDMNLALRLLYRARPRELAEMLILCGAKDDVVAHGLNARYPNMRCTKGTARMFRHYFWDTELLNVVDMRALLDMRNQALLDTEDKEIKAQFASLNRMRHNDPRTLAAKVPQTAQMSVVAQLNAGVLPKNVDTTKLVHTALTLCLMKLAESYTVGGIQGAQTSQSYAQTAEVLLRLKEIVTNPEEKLREGLSRINIASTPNRVPTIKQLTNGNFTQELQPTPTTDVIDVEALEEEDDD